MSVVKVTTSTITEYVKNEQELDCLKTKEEVFSPPKVTFSPLPIRRHCSTDAPILIHPVRKAWWKGDRAKMLLTVASTICALTGVPIGIIKINQNRLRISLSKTPVQAVSPVEKTIPKTEKSAIFKKLNEETIRSPLNNTIPLKVCLNITRSKDEESKHVSNWLIYSKVNRQHYCEIVVENKKLQYQKPDFMDCCYMSALTDEDLSGDNLSVLAHQTIMNTDAVFIKSVWLSYQKNGVNIAKKCFTEDMTLMSENGFGRLNAFEFWLDGGDKSCGGECCRSEKPCSLKCLK